MRLVGEARKASEELKRLGKAAEELGTLAQAPECLGRVGEAQQGLGMFEKSWPRLGEARGDPGTLRQAQGSSGGLVLQGARQGLGCPELRHTHSFHICFTTICEHGFVSCCYLNDLELVASLFAAI